MNIDHPSSLDDKYVRLIINLHVTLYQRRYDIVLLEAFVEEYRKAGQRDARVYGQERYITGARLQRRQ